MNLQVCMIQIVRMDFIDIQVHGISASLDKSEEVHERPASHLQNSPTLKNATEKIVPKVSIFFHKFYDLFSLSIISYRPICAVGPILILV